MKRKVIQLAGKTLVVSLPAKWARKCGVKKGDEMEVEESETGLSINCASSATCEKYVLDISGFNDSLIWYYLTSAYRRGCDEIEITFDNNLTENARTRKKLPVKNVISNIVDGLVGIEVVRHGKQYCLIKEISSVKEEEFESVFRKIFLLLLSLGEELSAAINENDPERLENIKYTEKNINKLVFFCERILNKSRAFSSRKHQVYFFVL